MRHTAQVSHTAHTTRLYKCCTQPVWLNKHSTKKKEELYVSKSDIDDNRPHWWRCNSSQLSSRLILIDIIVVVLIIQDDNENIIVAYRTVTCVVTPLAVTATLIEMFWCTTHFKRVSYCVSDSWHNWQKSTHSDSESESCWCTTADEFSFDSMWCIVVQTEHSHWAAQEWLLSEKSECTEWAAADQQRELNQHQQPQGWEQHMHCKEWGLCELSASRHISVWHLHCCCCWCCCCWACCMRVSADIFNQERFHIQSCEWRSWRRKKKKVVWGERVYNSLHWQISSSELSKKITQAMKKFSSANLTCTKQANTCQQTLTTIQQPFQRLKAQPWRKRKRWCHELNSY
jgi:hypothetical protein